MKFHSSIFCILFAFILGLPVKESFGAHPNKKYLKNLISQQPDPKYKYHQASTLSGITLQPNRRTGTFTLKFDQQLTAPGKLEVKNSAGKVFYSGILEASKELITRTLDIGKLYPGLYLIEVKTAGTTFWKKVRVRR